MSDKIKVLTVDDNATNTKLIVKGLKDNYHIESAERGKEALNMLSVRDYDIVLLDVNMPEMDGYQVCAAIREGQRNSQIPVIFVSALNTLDDKLKGYAAGAQDYIEKPVMLPELIQKIDLAVAQSKQLKSLDDQAKFATQTAMTAMSNNSELGIIIGFMEESFKTENNHELLKAITGSVAQYNIDCCVQLRTDFHAIHATSAAPEASRLEQDLLEKAKDADRIVTLGKRGIFNSLRVSILIRNLPVNNEELYGRLVDHLAVIVVAADERCKHIEMHEQKLSSRNKILDSVVDIADEEVEKLQEQFVYFRQETHRIMSQLQADIDEALVDFTLTDSQEDHFYRILGQGEREMDDLSDLGVVVEESLGRIKSMVTNAIENMD